jgi:hypothetical protein
MPRSAIPYAFMILEKTQIKLPPNNRHESLIFVLPVHIQIQICHQIPPESRSNTCPCPMLTKERSPEHKMPKFLPKADQ